PSASVATALGIEPKDLRRLNPSLLPSVWNGARYIPRGFELRVPAHIDLSATLAKLESLRVEAQLADTQHRVRRGDTLSGIAAEYGVSVAMLAELTGLRRPYLIRAGQVLALPVKPGAKPAATVARTERASKPPKAVPPSGVVSGAESYVVRRGDTL